MRSLHKTILGAFDSSSDLDDNLTNMLLRLQICVGIDGLLKGEYLIHSRPRRLGVGLDQADHVFEPEMTLVNRL